MLLIQAGNRLARDARELPSVTVVGFGVIGLAGVMEVLLYLAAGHPGGHQHGGFAPEQGAHLLGIIGMVLTLAGVFDDAVRHPTRRPSANDRRSETQCPSVTSSTTSPPRCSC